MSRTRHHRDTDVLCREFWASRLHRHGEIRGRFTKYLTHKKERRAKRRMEREALKEVSHA